VHARKKRTRDLTGHKMQALTDTSSIFRSPPPGSWCISGSGWFAHVSSRIGRIWIELEMGSLGNTAVDDLKPCRTQCQHCDCRKRISTNILCREMMPGDSKRRQRMLHWQNGGPCRRHHLRHQNALRIKKHRIAHKHNHR